MGAKIMVDAALLSIEKRQSRLEIVEAEGDQLRKEIHGLEVAISVLKQDWGDEDWDDDSADESPVSDTYDELLSSDDENIPISHKVRRAAYRVLREKRPMHRSKLLGLVQAQGLEFPERRPADTLTTYLSTDPRFCPFTDLRGYWTLTQEPTGKQPITSASEG